MATQTVEFRAASGLSLTVRLFAIGSDTIVQTASSCTEATNRKGTYAAVFTDPGAAEFELVALSGTTPVCRWFVTLTLTTATFQAYEVRTQAVVSRVTANTDQWNGVAVTGMPMPTYTQPTGFLAATFPANVSSYAGGAVASVAGSVGSIAGVTFPAHFDNLEITPNGHVTATVDAINNNAITASSIQANAITAAKIATDAIGAAQLAADAVTEIQSGLATASALATLTGYVDTEVAAIKVVTDRISTGLVADGAVWQFTANMLELAPAGGGGAGDASQTTLLEVQDTVTSIAASLSGVPITASGRIADGGTITLYCGDDLRVRSGSEITITVSDVGGAIFTRLDGIGTANLSWGASRQGLPASAISGTIASLSQSGSGASQTMTIVVEIDNAGSSLKPAEDYKWQIESQQDHGAETDSVVEMEGLLSLRRRVV